MAMRRKKAAAAKPREVRCYHCGNPMEVGAKTQSTNCAACNERVIVQDVEVKVLTPVSEIQTCGRVVVTKRGSVKARLVQALGGVEVLGRLEADSVVSGGPVIIARGGRWRADCRAPSLTIEEGAQVEGGRFAVPSEPDFRPT